MSDCIVVSKESQESDNDGMKFYRTCAGVGLYLGNNGVQKKDGSCEMWGKYYLGQLVSISNYFNWPSDLPMYGNEIYMTLYC